MRRRRLLASLGASTATVAAGCIGADRPDDDPASSTDGAGSGRGTTDGGEPSDDSRDRTCPPHPTERERAVCSHTVDEESAPVYLSPETETAVLDGSEPADPVTLTLYNQSGEDLRFNPVSWRIWHDAGDGWTELPPEVSGHGVLTVSAGETHSWTLLEAVESIRPEPDLEPCRYAAEIGVPDPAGGGWLACIALVRLERR